MSLTRKCLMKCLNTSLMARGASLAGCRSIHSTSSSCQIVKVNGLMACKPCSLDLYSKLYEHRVVFLTGPIREGLANHIVAQLHYLAQRDETKPIHLLISSVGGTTAHAFSIIDCMQSIKPEVHTHNIGQAFSAASMILSVGAKRYATTHSKVMIHETRATFIADDLPTYFSPMPAIRDEPESMKAFEERMDAGEDTSTRSTDVIARSCGMSYGELSEKMSPDTFMTAEEALEINLIDEINDDLSAILRS